MAPQESRPRGHLRSSRDFRALAGETVASWLSLHKNNNAGQAAARSINSYLERAADPVHSMVSGYFDSGSSNQEVEYVVYQHTVHRVYPGGEYREGHKVMRILADLIDKTDGQRTRVDYHFDDWFNPKRRDEQGKRHNLSEGDAVILHEIKDDIVVGVKEIYDASFNEELSQLADQFSLSDRAYRSLMPLHAAGAGYEVVEPTGIAESVSIFVRPVEEGVRISILDRSFSGGDQVYELIPETGHISFRKWKPASYEGPKLTKSPRSLLTLQEHERVYEDLLEDDLIRLTKIQFIFGSHIVRKMHSTGATDVDSQWGEMVAKKYPNLLRP